MTRLLIKLRATENTRYEMEYHKDIQGLIYGLLRGSEYDIHEKNGFKFFTFSNIFPFSDLRKNDRRNLLIASPNKDFVSYLKDQLEYLHDIRIGAMKFRIDYCSKFDIRLPSDAPVSLITGTPILCNIYRYRFEEANALHLVNGFSSTYWRSTHPVDLFLRQVEANLVKKFNTYRDVQAAMLIPMLMPNQELNRGSQYFTSQGF